MEDKIGRIRDALQNGNVYEVSELTGITEEEAKLYIEKFKEIMKKTMDKIKSSLSTEEETKALYELLYNLQDIEELNTHSKGF